MEAAGGSVKAAPTRRDTRVADVVSVYRQKNKCFSDQLS